MLAEAKWRRDRGMATRSEERRTIRSFMVLKIINGRKTVDRGKREMGTCTRFKCTMHCFLDMV